MTVRATVAINRGEQIFASYTLPLEGVMKLMKPCKNIDLNILDLGTKERRAVLRHSKLFECDCSRCSDPTECSTYLSALCCPKCTTGVVLPVRPLEEKEWQCSQCSYTLMASVVNRVVDQLKEEFESIGPNEVEKYICD